MKTVLIILTAMVVILLLFFNKITTPRYLSVMEHRINGLVLLREPTPMADTSDQWRLLFTTDKQQQTLTDWYPLLRQYIQAKTTVIDSTELAIDQPLPYDQQRSIGIVNPQGVLLGYFKPPFDHQRMILTYSSLTTHY